MASRRCGRGVAAGVPLFAGGERMVEQANSMLAMITAVGAELVQDALPLRTAGLLVGRINTLQVVPSRSLTHSVTCCSQRTRRTIANQPAGKASSDSPALEPSRGNPPYGILGEAMETSASFEARSAPLPYPTAQINRPTRRFFDYLEVRLGLAG
jgi:hypothetical protein